VAGITAAIKLWLCHSLQGSGLPSTVDGQQ